MSIKHFVKLLNSCFAQFINPIRLSIFTRKILFELIIRIWGWLEACLFKADYWRNVLFFDPVTTATATTAAKASESSR
ncbi:unnamed protein product [Trichobilharzia szidati]|nr:unnamed protein product [Trichobilharzia szidati]